MVCFCESSSLQHSENTILCLQCSRFICVEFENQIIWQTKLRMHSAAPCPQACVDFEYAVKGGD